MLTLDKVYRASHLLKEVARRTDMIESCGLVKDCDLRLKAENLQITGSFKVRGAFFKIASLSVHAKDCHYSYTAPVCGKCAEYKNRRYQLLLPCL